MNLFYNLNLKSHPKFNLSFIGYTFIPLSQYKSGFLILQKILKLMKNIASTKIFQVLKISLYINDTILIIVLYDGKNN